MDFFRWLQESDSKDVDTVLEFNETDIDKAEEEHNFDAYAALLLNVTIIGCLLLAYYVKAYRIYYLPERYGVCAIFVGNALL